MPHQENKTKYFVGMFIAMVLWGIAWTSGKAAVEHSNIQVSSFWRYFISFFGNDSCYILYEKISKK
jgi:drug/metabolite transporter (DMT)-like permease